MSKDANKEADKTKDAAKEETKKVETPETKTEETKKVETKAEETKEIKEVAAKKGLWRELESNNLETTHVLEMQSGLVLRTTVHGDGGLSVSTLHLPGGKLHNHPKRGLIIV